jgi:hypothetical protein
MPQCLLQRLLTEGCIHESRHRVSVGMFEGHTHVIEAGNVTQANDVIRLCLSDRDLRDNTRYVLINVNAHDTVPTATAADGGVHAPREQAQGVCWDVRGQREQDLTESTQRDAAVAVHVCICICMCARACVDDHPFMVLTDTKFRRVCLSRLTKGEGNSHVGVPQLSKAPGGIAVIALESRLIEL